MPIQLFRAENFRCLEKVEFDADRNFNLIHGANASGKTSLLEALAYLGRGKSFRGAPTQSLIRHGEKAFAVFGKAEDGERLRSIGVGNSSDGLDIRIDGEAGLGSAALAEALPLQVIDPEVHSLVSGGPEGRRRYLDWLAFHVEHEFLGAWRQFRRALKQRNAALRDGGRGLSAWDAEFVMLGEQVDRLRRSVLESCLGSLEEQGQALLGAPVGFEYRSGWTDGKSLAEAIADTTERDISQGATGSGPHRADIKLVYDDRQARRLVSRGQQKLLASSMIIAATEVVQTALERPLMLLLDDPAAELDQDALGRLLDQVFGLGSQVIATALEPDVLEFPSPPATFHVEHGRLTRL